MSKQFKRGIKTAFTSSRVVLIEKVNSNLAILITPLVNTSLFSSNVIPLPNGDVLVYQQSKKAAYSLIETDNPDIILVRGIIIKKFLYENVLLNKDDFSDFNLNLVLLNRLGQSVGEPIIYNLEQLCFSDLLLIPYSAKDIFLNYIVGSYYAYNDYIYKIQELGKIEKTNSGMSLSDYIVIKEREYRKTLMSILNSKDFPCFMIREVFSDGGMLNGRFLEELNHRKYSYGPGRRIINSREFGLMEFKKKAKEYDENKERRFRFGLQ